jgi:hypothetical protein
MFVRSATPQINLAEIDLRAITAVFQLLRRVMQRQEGMILRPRPSLWNNEGLMLVG